MTEIVVIAAFLMMSGVAIAMWRREASRRRTRPVVGGLDETVRVPSAHRFELYSNSFSHCSRKVRIVLAELGLDYAHRPVQLIETGWYETISSAYLKVNPSGLVPTFVHNGRPVYESDDILAYAQAVAGPQAPRLAPEDPDKRKQMEEWIAFGSISSADAMAGMEAKAGSCIPGLTLPLFVAAIRYIPLKNILVGYLFHPDKRRPLFFTLGKLLGLRWTFKLPPLRAMLRESAQHMRRHLAHINAALLASDGPWILGKDVTLADASIGCMLLRLEETGWLEIFAEEQELDALLSYFDRLKARPSWKAAIIDVPNAVIEAATSDLKAARSDPEMRRALYGS